MKLLICPLNGPRNIDEFQCLGPVRSTPDPEATSDLDWALYLFRYNNHRGVIEEWWRHIPSNHFFLAQRDTGTNEILTTYNPPTRGKDTA